MAILQAILQAEPFTEGADMMVNSLTRLFHSLDESYRTMQKFEVTMSTFSGSMNQAKDDLDLLFQRSNALGVSFESAAAPFAKFAGAATGLSKSQVFEVFNSFATALSAVRANGNEVNGVFLALQQIVSKGKLSMEELRLQLAERIPGAMTMAAQAAGMNMQQFEKAVAKGTIDSSKWIMDFSSILTEKFGPAAELAVKTFGGQMEILKNHLFMIQADLVEFSGAGDTWGSIVSSFSSELLQNDHVFSLLANSLADLSNVAMDLFGMILPLAIPTLEGFTLGIDLLARVVATCASVFYAVVASAYAFSSVLYELTLSSGLFFNIIDEGSATFDELKKQIDNTSRAANLYADKAVESFIRAGEPFQKMKRDVSELTNELSKGSTIIAKEVEKLKELATSLKVGLKEDVNEYDKNNKEKESSINEMYTAAGLGADMYFDQEATKLVRQVASWQKAGADIEKSNQYLYDKLDALHIKALESGEYTAAQNLQSYKDMSRHLVDQLNEDQLTIKNFLEEISGSIDGINLKKIEIKASLDGGAVISGIDDIIMKFQEFQSATLAVKQRPVTYNADVDGSWDDFLSSQKTTTSKSTGAAPITQNNYFPQSNNRSDAVNTTNEQARNLSRGGL